MSIINESLRKLEERGAIHQAALPPGVVATAQKKPAASSNQRLIYTVLALAAIWVVWSEWDRRHPVQSMAAVAAPLPVRVTAPAPPPETSVAVAAPAAALPTPATATASKPLAPKSAIATPASASAAAKPATPVPGTEVVLAPGAAPSGSTESPAATAPVPKPLAAAKKAAPSSAKQTSPAQKADGLYLTALQQLQEARGTDARQTLEEALELNPAHNNARQLLAALRMEDRQLGRAESLLSDGLAYHPGPAALVSLARLKVERGEDGAALKLLNDNLETGANDGDYQAFVAALLVRQGQPEQAVEHYRAAIARQPAQASWWAGLGLALAGQKDKRAEAAQALQRARQSGKLPAALADRVDSQLLALLRTDDKP